MLFRGPVVTAGRRGDFSSFSLGEIEFQNIEKLRPTIGEIRADKLASFHSCYPLEFRYFSGIPTNFSY